MRKTNKQTAVKTLTPVTAVHVGNIFCTAYCCDYDAWLRVAAQRDGGAEYAGLEYDDNMAAYSHGL